MISPLEMVQHLKYQNFYFFFSDWTNPHIIMVRSMLEKIGELQKITRLSLVITIVFLFVTFCVSGETLGKVPSSMIVMRNQTGTVQEVNTPFAQFSFPPGVTSITPSIPDVSVRKLEDQKNIDFDKSRAVALPKDRIILTPPKKVDYTPYLSFIRTQDGNGGCLGFTLMHLMDILKEMEHPYTPDKSFAYMHLRQEQLRDKEGVPDTKMSEELITKYGVASEVVYPSDYSGCTKNSEGIYVTDNMPPLSDTAKNEATYYKIKSQEFTSPVDVDTLKTLLNEYGPVGGQGGSDVWVNHSMLIVGYDDATENFKVLNSWGDYWKYGGGIGDGFFFWPYSRVSEISMLKSLVNEPSDRSGGDYAYTARIGVNAPYSRNSLVISIGVEGETPLTIWNAPNKIGPWPDYNSDLTLDVYLPSYAKSHWPPGDEWYVKVSNTGAVNAVVDEIVFAKLNKDLLCKTVGRFTTDTYKPSPGTLPVTIPPKSEKMIYLSDPGDSQKPELDYGEISVERSLNLLSGTVTGLDSLSNTAKAAEVVQINENNLKNYVVDTDLKIPDTGEDVDDTGKVLAKRDIIEPGDYTITDQSNKNLIRSVTIYRLVPEVCVNMPDKWDVIGTAVIEGDNTFSFTIPQQYILDTLAVAYSDSGTVVVSSEPIPSPSKTALTKEPLTEKAIDFSVDPIAERNKVLPLRVNPI